MSKWVGDRAAVLMANHGLLTVGKSPKDALKIANLVELTAEMMWGARQLGEIVPLPDSTRAEDGADLQDAPRDVTRRRDQERRRDAAADSSGRVHGKRLAARRSAERR